MSNGAKKAVTAFVIIGIIVLVVAILLRNKATFAEKAKNTAVLTEYPVTVAKVTKETVPLNLSMVGTTYGNQEVTMLSETQGKVVQVFVNVGSYVSKGSPIVQLDDEIKKATLVNAEANYEKSKKDYDRYSELFKEKSINESQLDAAKLAYKVAESQLSIARKQLSDTRITAPFAGVITARMVEVGSVLGTNTQIVTLVDISTLKIKLNVAEKDAFKMKVGDEVSITSDVYPQSTLKGKIKNISDKGDEAHTYPVEVNIANNRSTPLRAGMFARVTFGFSSSSDCVIIPREALVGSMREPKVYVVENNRAVLRKIAIANDLGTKLQISQGLKDGETIVVNGQLNLKDNDKISIINQSN